ncbi:MAG: peptidylprolyl isomerase, partial [Coriobacteriales bacterium]|nr:peptidylprolyl isomerase [Coriobacteriales bacterium]
MPEGLNARIKRLLVCGAIALASLASCFALGACADKSVAATVNGEPIYESDVSDYITQMRSFYGLEDDVQWAEYLKASGITAADLREDAIGMFADRIIVEKCAEENGLSVDDSEVDSYVNGIKEQYESDSAFQDALAMSGFTEETFRQSYHDYLLETAIKQNLLEFDRPSDSEVAARMSEYASNYNGRKSSHILFDKSDRETALSVLKELENGADFAEMAKKYSTDSGSAAKGGDVGWDCLTTFVEPYQNALDGLKKGEMTSDLVESEFGYHIILCTDVFNYKTGDKIPVNAIPEELYQEIYEALLYERQEAAYSTFLDGLRESA